jgi:hypothetical protein
MMCNDMGIHLKELWIVVGWFLKVNKVSKMLENHTYIVSMQIVRSNSNKKSITSNVGNQSKERTGPSHDRKLSHPQPL